ncbi:hypothetical protein [Termitidicoccus mucosus]|uniref:hypothetical protein n=2 Tax=Termitidicoccus mucosus TaxID=1184151 RepID=UPI0008391274
MSAKLEELALACSDAVLNVTSASVVRSLIANAQTGVEFVGIVRMQAEKEKIAWLESRRSKKTSSQQSGKRSRAYPVEMPEEMKLKLNELASSSAINISDISTAGRISCGCIVRALIASASATPDFIISVRQQAMQERNSWREKRRQYRKRNESGQD